jgi:hypothetical protein
MKDAHLWSERVHHRHTPEGVDRLPGWEEAGPDRPEAPGREDPALAGVHPPLPGSRIRCCH